EFLGERTCFLTFPKQLVVLGWLLPLDVLNVRQSHRRDIAGQWPQGLERESLGGVTLQFRSANFDFGVTRLSRNFDACSKVTKRGREVMKCDLHERSPRCGKTRCDRNGQMILLYDH